VSNTSVYGLALNATSTCRTKLLLLKLLLWDINCCVLTNTAFSVTLIAESTESAESAPIQHTNY